MITENPTVKKILYNQIKTYLIENPITNRGEIHCYNEVADLFGVSKETIRHIYRRLRNQGLVPNDDGAFRPDINPYYPLTTEGCFKKKTNNNYEWAEDSNKGEAQLKTTVGIEIKNENDLIRECEIDTGVWEVTSWRCKAYNAWIKNKSGEIETKQLYSVHVSLKRKSIDNNIELQKEAIIDEIKSYSPSYRSKFPRRSQNNRCLYEISIPDLHIGKLAWKEETGDEYNIDIACQEYDKAVSTLLNRIPDGVVDRFLLPIGNDMINVNGAGMTTFKGTPQSTSGKFPQMLRAAKKLLIETIDSLLYIAPVDVVVVPGNHDLDPSFSLGEILEAWYHNTPDVEVDNSPTSRKYYKYGATGLMFAHGDEEKHQDLGLLFATERKDIWFSTQFHEAQLGHWHKRKETKYVSVDEHPGFQIRIMPSLSGADTWHSRKGFKSLKGAVGILYDKEEGIVGNYPYNIPVRQ